MVTRQITIKNQSTNESYLDTQVHVMCFQSWKQLDKDLNVIETADNMQQHCAYKNNLKEAFLFYQTSNEVLPSVYNWWAIQETSSKNAHKRLFRFVYLLGARLWLILLQYIMQRWGKKAKKILSSFAFPISKLATLPAHAFSDYKDSTDLGLLVLLVSLQRRHMYAARAPSYPYHDGQHLMHE